MKQPLQHIAPREDIEKVFGTGEKATALCGKRWAPLVSGDESRPICPKCLIALGPASATPYRAISPMKVSSVTCWSYEGKRL